MAIDLAIFVALVALLWSEVMIGERIMIRKISRRLSVVFAEEKPEDRKTAESRHVQN